MTEVNKSMRLSFLIAENRNNPEKLREIVSEVRQERKEKKQTDEIRRLMKRKIRQEEAEKTKHVGKGLRGAKAKLTRPGKVTITKFDK